jgi:hypothetical protein
VSATNGRATALEILERIATTPAERRAVARLKTNDLRTDDRPALEALADSEELSRAEHRMVERALTPLLFAPTETPRPAADPDIERRILEANAAEAAALVDERQRLDVVLVADAAMRRARPEEIEGRRAELQAAEAEYAIARDLLERARSRSVAVERERDARLRAFTLERTTKR